MYYRNSLEIQLYSTIYIVLNSPNLGYKPIEIKMFYVFLLIYLHTLVIFLKTYTDVSTKKLCSAFIRISTLNGNISVIISEEVHRISAVVCK